MNLSLHKTEKIEIERSYQNENDTNVIGIDITDIRGNIIHISIFSDDKLKISVPKKVHKY